MAAKRVTSRIERKLPVALFAAAAATLIYGLAVGGGRADSRPQLPNPHQMALLSVGRVGTSKAVELWEQRVQANPASATLVARLAESTITLAGETGDLSLYAKAEVLARKAVQIDPDNESANLTLASALSGQHDFAGALRLADGVLARTPRSVGARIAAADAHLELGDDDLAAAAHTELANEFPDAPPILSRQARLAAMTGRLDEAIELARTALIRAGEDDLDTYTGAFYWFQLANFQHQHGDYDAAAATLDSALQVEPRHLGSIELRGKVLVAQRKYDQAIALYEDLLKTTDAADLRGQLAALYAHDGRTADARRELNRGLEIARADATKYPAERRHLIGFLSDADPAFAVELARADLQQRTDVHSYAWLAWSLLQAGKPHEALTYVDDAVRLGTQDPWLLYQAGSVYAAVGDNATARTMLTAALDLSPEFDLVHAQRARALLASLPDAG